MIKRNRKIYEDLVIAVCLCFLLLFLVRGIELPFVGNNAWNFNTYSLIAHNYIALGFLKTYFAPIISVSEALPAEPSYYLHHPPLLSIFQALSFLLFNESFISARIPVILASFFSAFLLYLIGKLLIGKTYAIWCLIVSVLMPGFVIFGRMIGQEPLVLFFALLLFYSILKYLITERTRYIFVVFVSIVFGALSDWPMVYFSISLLPFLLYKKEKKLAFTIIGVSVVTASAFFLYNIWLTRGIDDLLTAFMVRSPGELLKSPAWLITWPVTILFRILIYFSPLFVMGSVIGFVQLLKTRSSTNRQLSFACLSFLIFGVIHILLYPEGSFGHAYWIYYLIPFIVFTSGSLFLQISRYRYVTIFLIVFSIIYFVFIENWKYKEMVSNMFRYYLARAVTSDIPQYEKIYMNADGVIDFDMMEYQFLLNPQPFNARANEANFFVHSCRVKCDRQKIAGVKAFTLIKKIYSQDGEVYLFGKKSEETLSEIQLDYKAEKENNSLLKKIFLQLKTVLKFPQL